MQPDQFEAVFQRHFDRVHHVVARLLGDPDEAEDLTLEAFWRLWRTPGVEDGSCGPWLYRVATRLGYNALRARARRSAYERAAMTEDSTLGSEADPAAEAERRLALQRVREAMRRLPARHAQIISLRLSGLSYRDIAAALEVNPSSVGALLARAEARFEQVYRELDSADERTVGT